MYVFVFLHSFVKSKCYFCIALKCCTSELDNELKSDSEDVKIDHFTGDIATMTVDTNSTLPIDLPSAVISVPTNEVCSWRTFYTLVYRNVCRAGSKGDEDENIANETDSAAVMRRIVCSQRSQPDSENGTWVPSVQIFNSSELLAQLGTRVNSSMVGRCTVVLFYAPWCSFCARLAPHYNALARAFPSLDIVAVDAFHFSSLNSRFGTIAVPNIMVFHNAKAVARFNSTDRTLPNLASFITNITGIVPDPLAIVTPEDEIGPLPSTVTAEIDYLLIVSWLFVLSCMAVACVRSSTGRRVWNTLVAIGNHGEGRHHLHLD